MTVIPASIILSTVFTHTVALPSQPYWHPTPTPDHRAHNHRYHSHPHPRTQALNERGERLSRLEEKTALMETEAQEFVSLIQEYNKKEAAKKWWQI
jgi:hypothetical protein